MLPPQSRSTTRLPASSGSCPERQAASGGRGGAFDDAFLQFDDAQNRERDLFFIHEHHLVGVLAGDLERVAPDLGDGETVGQRRACRDANRLPGLQRGGKTRDVIRFDRDDFRLRPQGFDRERDAGEQTAAAHRHDDGIEIGNLLDDFEAHRSLARR